MEKLKIMWELYIFAAKLGAFVVGGGYAMLPIMQKEMVETKHWVTAEEMSDYLAVSQSVPGLVSINTLTFVGNKLAGPLGAIAATLGIITAPFIIIVLITMFFEEFKQNLFLQRALLGVRAVVVALMAAATLSLAKPVIKNNIQLMICLLSALVMIVTGISPIYIIIATGLLGIVLTTTGIRRENKK